MSRTSNIHEVSETVATFERQLENGQTLLYQMQVLQQPERARACGMGAKSHADRRPVDPPPVVELRLFSGPEQADVTFSHNSNFFLYASLEHARPVAQARGMPAPAPAPVLTGVPVSGMAYLDRPAPAGYFIFPDLSVRHEGRYRLRFALYEDTKEQHSTNDPHEPREYCVHRLDVKSKAFTVFSAKKFPGLAESTALSRIVAEQGCRVRIRRDVRMRRRNDRPRGRESEDSMDETAMLRAQRRHTPDQYDMEDQMSSQPPQHCPTPQYQQPPPPYSMHRSESVDSRKRSGSDVSVASVSDVSHTPRYNAGQYNMPPAQNHSSYGHPVPTPPPPQQHSVNHLSFIHPTPTPAPPSQQYTPQPQVPSQDVYGRNGYMSETHSRPHSQYQAPPPPTYHNTREQLPTNGQRRNSVDDYRQRRDSDTAYHPSSHYRPGTPVVPQPQPYNGQMSNGYGHQPQPQYAPQAHPPMYIPQQQQQQPLPPPPPPQQQGPAIGLPPLRLPPISDSVPRVSWSQPPTPSATAPPQNSYPPPQPHRAVPPPQSIAPSQVPIPSPSQFPAFYPDKYVNGYSPAAPPQPPVETPKKRPWGRVFNTAHTEGALRGGMRPDTEGDVYGSDASTYVAPDTDGDGYDDIGKLKMTYRRADGVEIVRKLHGEA